NVVFSSMLAEVTVADPEFSEQLVADCIPTEQYASSRVINFQDRIAITTPSGPSAVPPEDRFADYPFWSDKLQKKMTLGVMILFCDGRIEIPRDEAGRPLTASLMVYRSLLREGSGNTLNIFEIKQGSLTFKGDPLAFRAPDLIVE